MGLAPSGNRENRGGTGLAKVPVPILSQPRRASIKTAKAWAGGEFCLYLLLAVWATWPLARQPGTSLTVGTETAATVPLFTTWTVWWNGDRASRGFRDYWTAPIFFPDADTFAFSEPMVTTSLVAPMLWLSGNPLLAHNVFLLLALALNGWAGFHLLREVGVRRRWAAVGGGWIVWLPMVQNELGVLQLVPLGGILWTMLCLVRFAARPGVVRAAWLGTAFAATYLTCANYGLFFSLLLPLGGVWLVGGHLRELRTWAVLPVAVLAATALLAPVVVVQLRVAREHGLVRSPELARRLSAQPADYLVAPRPSWIEPAPVREHRQRTHFPLFPGLWHTVFAIVGAWGGLARGRRRAWTGFCLTVLGIAWLLSLGPRLELAGWSPYVLLMDWYPGFGQIRSPFRFAVFVQLTTVLLAGCGLAELGRAVSRITAALPRRGQAVLAGACIVAFAGPAFWETRPQRQTMFTPPTMQTQRGWIDWLQTNTASDAVIACLPFPTSGHVAEYEPTALWMYWSTFHRRRLVNGYSGFLPKEYAATKRQMVDFPDRASIDRLRSHGVTYCIIPRSHLTRADIEGDATAGRHLQWRYGDDLAGVDIYFLLTEISPSPGRNWPRAVGDRLIPVGREPSEQTIAGKRSRGPRPTAAPGDCRSVHRYTPVAPPNRPLPDPARLGHTFRPMRPPAPSEPLGCPGD